MNGKQGDAPFTDIVAYQLEVFHPKVDQLVRDLESMDAFADPFAREMIHFAAAVWRGESLTDETRAVWLRNFACTLWVRLVECEGVSYPSAVPPLPDERDPDVG